MKLNILKKNIGFFILCSLATCPSLGANSIEVDELEAIVPFVCQAEQGFLHLACNQDPKGLVAINKLLEKMDPLSDNAKMVLEEFKGYWIEFIQKLKLVKKYNRTKAESLIKEAFEKFGKQILGLANKLSEKSPQVADRFKKICTNLGNKLNKFSFKEKASMFFRLRRFRI